MQNKSAPLLYSYAALATAFILLALICLLGLMLQRGMAYFWPPELVQFQYMEAGKRQEVAGQLIMRQQLSEAQRLDAGYPDTANNERILIKVGYVGPGQPAFRWYWQHNIATWQIPDDLALVRHVRWGDIVGRVSESASGALTVVQASGQRFTLQRQEVALWIMPNTYTFLNKLTFFLQQWWQFLSTEPREANSAGGILPAIVGTLLSVMLMAVIVAPIGILAGIYLHEYAKEGRLVRLVRISVHNLAGVPSVVFGVFGLGFFVYVLGGSIDQLFYTTHLPQPTFGTPGLVWVSLTLALLTLPVVIVATEEGLARVPQSLRLGGYAVGATKAEVLRKLILPVARPAFITGIILAIARAAGEVAPLIFVGVVKYAPSLPLSTEWPYLHPEQQIMSLGFQIYDVGLQSSNADAAEPRVYAIALVLLLLIGSLNLLAMRLRRHYRMQTRLGFS